MEMPSYKIPDYKTVLYTIIEKVPRMATSVRAVTVGLAGVVESCLRGVEAEARLRSISLDSDIDESITAKAAPEKVERVFLSDTVKRFEGFDEIERQRVMK